MSAVSSPIRKKILAKRKLNDRNVVVVGNRLLMTLERKSTQTKKTKRKTMPKLSRDLTMKKRPKKNDLAAAVVVDDEVGSLA
jgi:hypothetical protein